MPTDQPSQQGQQTPHEPAQVSATNLLAATNRLNESVLALADKLDISDRTTTRTRRLAGAIGALVLVFGLIGAIQWHRISNAVQGNQDVAVQSCENANETRAASLSLWTTVLTYTKATASENTAKQIDTLLNWIAILYQPRDCSDLDREYRVPPPPVLDPTG